MRQTARSSQIYDSMTHLSIEEKSERDHLDFFLFFNHKGPLSGSSP